MVDIRLRGANGQEVTVAALVDSGFNGSLIIPRPLAHSLGLTPRGNIMGILADGTVQFSSVSGIGVHWMGVWRLIVATMVGDAPLIGMNLLEGCELKIACVSGGSVEIKPLP